jgi:hypothetical protein
MVPPATPTIMITVEGLLPPAKNEAVSLFAAGHGHAKRVRALLDATRSALGGGPPPYPARSESLGLELVLTSPTRPPGDATNYLGGVADVLQDKSDRPNLDLTHLGDLAAVAVYADDSLLHDVRYRWDCGDRLRYTVRIWAFLPRLVER